MRRAHGDTFGDMMGGRGDMFRDMDNMMNSMMRGFGPNMVILQILLDNSFFSDTRGHTIIFFESSNILNHCLVSCEAFVSSIPNTPVMDFSGYAGGTT